VGYYSRFGDIQDNNVFAAAYGRTEIDPDGFLRAVGLHLGLRETWVGNGGDKSDQPVAYTAVELELPCYFSLMGEVSTLDLDVGKHTPYGVGLQWRYGAFNITVSALNIGAFDEPSFFWGIGPQWSL
jgi:hypothetical protein